MSNVDYVPGLRLIEDFVGESEALSICQWLGAPVDNRVAEGERNRVLRFGPGVQDTGYSSGEVQKAIPPLLGIIAERLVVMGVMSSMANAISVNEYLIGQTIYWHKDKPDAGIVIPIASVIGEGRMGFRKSKREPKARWLTFPERALVVLAGESRLWEHCIDPVPTRRVSIVFRRSLDD